LLGVFIERPEKNQLEDMTKSSIIVMETSQTINQPIIPQENEKSRSEPITSSIQSTASSDKPVDGKKDSVKVKIDPKGKIKFEI
jgi:hypothetical protein